MYVNSWDDFEKAAERLYLQDPIKVRCNFLNVGKDDDF